MKSRTTRRFWECYTALPQEVKARTASAFEHWQDDPRHPGLSFKKIHSTRPIWSVRIGLDYRAVGVVEDDAMSWFWIGSHADYDRLIRRFR